MKLDGIGHNSTAGALGGRAGALPPGPIAFPFVPMVSGVF